jgi:hypothetical protein
MLSVRAQRTSCPLSLGGFQTRWAPRLKAHVRSAEATETLGNARKVGVQRSASPARISMLMMTQSTPQRVLDKHEIKCADNLAKRRGRAVRLTAAGA